MSQKQVIKSYPVFPLIIPNNCNYDSQTNRMYIDPNKSRSQLKLHPQALELIRNIASKISTISIVGVARTGKSLVAGELYAPKHIPCPFELGHEMDACTYGVWVSAKPIPHPKDKDTVILIFDVEGTGFHENTKQNDMQIMVITLLISSYFIYNTKGTFNSAALDELEFVTELTERIQLKPNDENGNGLEHILPKFMWLLRDVHLKSTINDEKVSVKDYFTKKVLKYEKGRNKKVQKRQNVRSMFLQTFREYDAFTLPIPHAQEDVLQQLGAMERDKLEPQFIEQLSVFCNKVMEETPCKVLFVQNGKEEKEEQYDDDDEEENIEISQFIHCTGSHLAGWIEECVKYVNDPEKVPQISSMTAAVMSNVFRESKQRAIAQYEELLWIGLNTLRKNDQYKALENKDIIDLHLKAWNTVLVESGCSLQSIYNDFDDEKNVDFDEMNEVDKEQIKVYSELCHEIGHNNNVTKIGESGILHKVLTENMNVSKVICNKYLNAYFNENIKPMLDAPQQHEATEVIAKWSALSNSYYKECQGPATKYCWTEFENDKKCESIEQFKKMKGYSDKLAKSELVKIQKVQIIHQLKNKTKLLKDQKQQQQRAHKQERNRMNDKMEEQKHEMAARSEELKQQSNDARMAMFLDLSKSLLSTGVQCYFMNKKHQMEKENNKKESNRLHKLTQKVNKIEKATEVIQRSTEQSQQQTGNDDAEWVRKLIKTAGKVAFPIIPILNEVPNAIDCLTQ